MAKITDRNEEFNSLQNFSEKKIISNDLKHKYSLIYLHCFLYVDISLEVTGTEMFTFIEKKKQNTVKNI